MRIEGPATAYVGGTTGLALPTRSSYAPPRKRATGLNWGPSKNPAVWPDYVPPAPPPPASVAEPAKKATRKGPIPATVKPRICDLCKKEYTKHPSQSRNDFRKRSYCGRACSNRAKALAKVAQ